MAVSQLLLAAFSCSLADVAPLPLPAPALEAPVLALAFVGSARDLVALTPTAVLHLRLRRGALTLRARAAIEDVAPVRHPGGLLHAEAGARSVWALASGWTAARLLDLEAGLKERGRAQRLPWQGAPGGVAFRSGTDQIETGAAGLPGLGSGPYLSLAGPAALGLDGALLRRGSEPGPLRLGPPLTLVSAGCALASEPGPPGQPDALLSLSLKGEPRVLSRRPLPGAVRAVALAPGTQPGIVLVAVENEGAFRLLALQLSP